MEPHILAEGESVNKAIGGNYPVCGQSWHHVQVTVKLH